MGLDVELFQDEVPADLVCALCDKVLVHPVEGTCTHVFCGACLKRHLRADKTRSCPTCPARLGHKTTPVCPRLAHRLLDLLIRCNYDCGQVCKLAELPDHVSDECPNAPVSCPHQKKGCWMKVRRGEVGQHVQECDYRTVSCEACGQKVVRIDLSTHQSRKKCLEKKLRQQLIKAMRETNLDVRHHRQSLDRQHVRLEQRERQRFMDHFRQSTAGSCLQYRNYLHTNNSHNNSSNNSPGNINNDAHNHNDNHGSNINHLPGNTVNNNNNILNSNDLLHNSCGNSSNNSETDSPRGQPPNHHHHHQPPPPQPPRPRDDTTPTLPEMQRLHTDIFMASGLKSGDDGEMTIVFNAPIPSSRAAAGGGKPHPEYSPSPTPRGTVAAAGHGHPVEYGYAAPSPSRAGQHHAVSSRCRNCCKKFRPQTNSPNACRWHQGVGVHLHSSYRV